MNMIPNFRVNEDGEVLIEKNYKIKRMKELTTEICNLQHQVKVLNRQIHEKKHFLNNTKSYKTYIKEI